MKSQPSLSDTLRDLRSVEALRSALVQTAADSVRLAGGADDLIARLGRRTGTGFWGLRPTPERLWEFMAK